MLHLTVLLATATSLGQVESNYEQLKAMEWAMGAWRRDAVAENDTKNANKGDKTSKEWRLAWTANKNAVLITQVATVNGKTVGQVDSLFGWNKAKQEIAGNGYATDGVAGGEWTITTSNQTFTITAGSSDWVFSKMGNDKLIVTTNLGKRLGYQRVKSNRDRKD